MVLQIDLNHLTRQFTRRHAKITARPKVAPPVAFLPMRILLKQLRGGPPFDPPHNLGRRHLRRGRDQQMHMVLTDHTAQDVEL